MFHHMEFTEKFKFFYGVIISDEKDKCANGNGR